MRNRVFINILISLILILLISEEVIATNKRAKEKKPNVIVVLVDDLGWKDLGCMGSSYYETPNIDLLAKESLVFTNGYAGAANCAPSRACLMSGQNTPRHGVYTVSPSSRGNKKTRKLIPTPNTKHLKDEIVTMGEMFKQAGYETIALGKWHLGQDPTTQGFDINIAGDTRGNPGKNGYFAPYNVGGLEDASAGENLTDRLTEEACRFIETNEENPFFVYLSYYAVHTPLATTPELMEKYSEKQGSNGQDRADFAGMVETIDNNVGKVIDQLNRSGLQDNTMIVFTSDNGGIRDISYQDPLRAGKGSYYEGGLRVPFMVKYPRYIKEHKTIDYPVVNMDLFPTFMELTSTKLKGKTLDGKSLVPLLKGEEHMKERALYWHFPIYLQAYNGKEDQARDPLFRTRPGSVIRYGKWKLHEYFEEGVYELYDLDNDLGETNNVAEEHPVKVKELVSILNTWRNDIGAPIPTELNPYYDPIFEKDKIRKTQK